MIVVTCFCKLHICVFYVFILVAQQVAYLRFQKFQKWERGWQFRSLSNSPLSSTVR